MKDKLTFLFYEPNKENSFGNMWIKYVDCCNSFIPKTIGKAMGTHKNKKKKIAKASGRSGGHNR